MSEANAVLDQFLEPIQRVITPSLARELVAFRPDLATQAHIDEVARKSNEGAMGEEERQAYLAYVEAGDLISYRQAKAREVLV